MEGVVSVRPVGRENWRAVAALDVSEAQRAFVAAPAHYLCLCHYEGLWQPLAIRAGEKVVGFLMWAIDPEDESCWLGGILVDRRHQRRGYGRRGIEAALAWLEAQGHHDFALSYDPTNSVARHLYAALGFEETGEREGDEVVARRRGKP